MTVPRVSIGLPVYNGEAYLEEALNSILSQTYGNFELIISDNASTDGTAAICRLYAENDARVRYVRHETNRGGAANFNGLIALARGEYFRWACHDDTLAPTCIERCVEVLDAEPATVLCYVRPQMIGPDGEPLDNSRYHLKSLHLRHRDPTRRFRRSLVNYYPVGGMCNAIFGLMRRQVLAQTARINNYPDSDIVLLGELALWGKYYEIQDRLFFRRDHPLTSVRANPGAQERALWFDPENEGRLILPYWLRFIEYVRAIRRAPLTPAERARCYVLLVRHYVRHKYRAMYREARAAAHEFLSRRGRKQTTPPVAKTLNQVHEHSS